MIHPQSHWLYPLSLWPYYWAHKFLFFLSYFSVLNFHLVLFISVWNTLYKCVEYISFSFFGIICVSAFCHCEKILKRNQRSKYLLWLTVPHFQFWPVVLRPMAKHYLMNELCGKRKMLTWWWLWNKEREEEDGALICALRAKLPMAWFLLKGPSSECLFHLPVVY